MKVGAGGTAVLAFFILMATTIAEAREPSARRAFARENPCPVTGKASGKCPGWHVDHVVPLCAGGADHPGNMQWLEIQEHKQKTRVDVLGCRIKKRKEIVNGFDSMP